MKYRKPLKEILADWFNSGFWAVIMWWISLILCCIILIMV
jgi:hypothetical protein